MDDYDGPHYDNMYTHYFYEVARNSTTWAHPEAERCGCCGGGWWSSEVDTWHKCPYHEKNARHPEAHCHMLEDFGTYDEYLRQLLPPTEVVKEQVAEYDDCPF